MNYEGQLSAQHHPSLGRTAPRVNLAATHAESIHITTTMQKVQAHDDDTLGSGSSNPNLENETDTLDRRIMQHERDARRLQNATRGDPQPLLKPRARPRVSDLVGRREHEETEASRQQHIRAGSPGSNDSNPPLNVPREWGTRAKSHRGWMRKIRGPPMTDINDPGRVADRGLLTPEEDAEPSQETSYARNIWNRDDDHAAALENTPPSMKRPRPNAPNGAIRDTNTTLRQIIDSGDHDFSDLSLLTSTPATTKPVRGGLARNDAEPVERRYNTTAYRQDLLSERSPNRNSTRARERGNGLAFDDKRTVPRREDVPRPATSSYAEARLARRTGLVSNKENVPVDDTHTRAVYSRTSETVTIADRTARAVTFKQHQRPLHVRNGSQGLLQRLATSLSPSPGKPSSEAIYSSGNEARPSPSEKGIHRRPTETGHLEPNQPVIRRANRKSSGSQGEEAQPRPQPNHALFDKTKQSQTTRQDETPAPRDQPLQDKTPVVTGAWVDTPGLTKDLRPSFPSSHTAPTIPSASKEVVLHNNGERDPDRTPYRDPNRPKSVLEEIVRDARKDPTGAFGDATIQSLEDIVHPNTDPTDTTPIFDAGGARKDDAAEDLDLGRPLTQAEKDRRQEDLAIEAMNKHLRAARTSIKDADRGLQRVENNWESTSHIESTQAQPKSTEPKQVVTLDRDWKTVCDHCGGSYHSLWWGLWTELRSCFYVYDKNARFGFRITWPGILVLTWLLWNILENLLCYHYCHPLYAEYMVGYGVNPDAPRYPFVIPTLLFRPLRPVWKPVLKWLEASCSSGFYMVFGEPARVQPLRRVRPVVGGFDGLAGRYTKENAWTSTSTWVGRTAATAVGAAGRGASSFVDAVDAMGGETMGDDEWL